MRIIYTDENSRLRDFAKLMSSSEFRNLVKGNLNRISRYDYGMVRVKPNLCKERFGVFLNAEGFEIGKETKHANGIGNNNKNYVQDITSGEYIGALHLNSDMYGSVYCYATDIHDARVSDTYCISPHKITLEHVAEVSWDNYQFGKEEHALRMINDAVKLGILQEGPNGGIMVYKQFDDGAEGWQEVKKDFAAKDLVKQNTVSTLSKQIKEYNAKNSLDALIEATSTRAAKSQSFDITRGKEPDPER